MKTSIDCIPCFMQQALRAGRMTTSDEVKIKKVLDEVGNAVKDIPMESTPPETGMLVYDTIKNVTGIDDPYKKIKEENIQEALRLYPALKKRVEVAKDPLMTAIRIAIAGNVIDLGVHSDFDIEKDIEKVLEQEFAINDYKEFKDKLEVASHILYLGDNAGESVFDKLLIEQLNRDVTYVVRESPIINDVTYKEAELSGLYDVAEVISSGSKAPATILKFCTPEFLERFNAAPLIISKGQGNYEGLSGEKDVPLFFMLKAKCDVISANIGVDKNAIVFKAL